MILASLFGSKHIIGFLFSVVIVIGVLFILLRKGKNKEYVIFGLTISLFVFEYLKIGFLVLRDGNYPMNHLPFHLCSFPLFAFLILSVSKHKKLNEFIKPAAFATTLFGGTIALLYPANILGGVDNWSLVQDNFLPYVSFAYHAIMMIASLYLVLSRYYVIKKYDLYKAYIASFVFMVAAMIVNVTLDKDYMLLTKGNGSPFAFLIETSNLLYTIVMILLGLLAITLFYGIGVLIQRKD